MKVTHFGQNMLCIQYQQEDSDEDYGSCLWARFYFNTDKFELFITSDCGNYIHKWPVTEAEPFLQLMNRVEKGYLIYKLYGKPDVFDYEATKNALYINNIDDRDHVEELDRIFNEIESLYGEPESGNEFVRMFDDANNGTFSDSFEMPIYRYPYGIKKVASIFIKYVQPEIAKILEEEKGE